MEENKQQSYTDQIFQLAGENCTAVTSAKEYVFTKEDLLWFVNDLSILDRDAKVQSLQQQNEAYAARIEMLMQSSDEKFNEKVGWYSDLKTRIAELEKQLKEAQEKG
jgi:hypothetical protein